MNFLFHDKAITGNLVVLPAHEQDFLDDMKAYHAPEARSRKLKEIMGFDKHRLVQGDTCVSDLVVFGFEHLFRTGRLGRDDFDALILCTQSPDHFVPPTSNIIQGRLGLKHDLLCLDINQGCAGFVVGLIEAFLLLTQPSVRRVAVVTADVISRKVSPEDRNSYPLVGDAIAITLVENAPGAGPIHANLKMDGTRALALRIPAGGFRQPSTPETALLRDAGDGNRRAEDHLCMDGTAVFNFVMAEVPLLIEDLLRTAGVTDAQVDAYAFHQPNRFMLQKLADKLGVAHAKMPMDIVGKFGNASGVTIPTVLAHSLADRLLRERLNLCLSGFGVGLTWASLLLPVGPLAYCECLDFPDPVPAAPHP
jgi:3-oxoacyl-[acyl-carrier-protein] synthase-3